MDDDTATLSASARVAELQALTGELLAIRAEMLAAEREAAPRLGAIHPAHRASAHNLLHYLALRRRDLRPLQLRLAALGLSSLGRAESHVLATVEAVLRVLHDLAGRPWQPTPPEAGGPDFSGGQRRLTEHTQALFGPARSDRTVRIMVTMPSEAAEDRTLAQELPKQGMDCMRINCAHDDPAAWLRMIAHLRLAERALQRSCRIVMDLAGPKLRTGPLEPRPAVVRVRPQRDAFGRVLAPARVWLTAAERPVAAPSPGDVCVQVPAVWLERLRRDDRVRLTDARGAKRWWRIVEAAPEGCWAEVRKTTYLLPGTSLRHPGEAEGAEATAAPVSGLPSRESALLVQPGDMLLLTRDLKPGHPASLDSGGRVLTPATIGCTLPEVFDDVRPGEAIWFDDGKIGGVIERVEEARLVIQVTQTRVGGARLRNDQGINLPDSALRLTALSAKDIADLAFAAQYADVVELSFANRASDVELLQQHLARLGPRQPAIVIKIETRRGFENLPSMLLAAMRAPCCGVMIARGDLAVECGFERLAEVQEEILWICEAAHVPVIWATQVLESLATQGMPSRAETTDAAMGHRAECVMLNKGPHVVRAVQMLDDILRRMQAHQAKERAMLRELRLARAYPTAPDDPRGAETRQARTEGEVS
ncbi:MAG: pyruvate kinase [Chloroflexota bacterium]